MARLGKIWIATFAFIVTSLIGSSLLAADKRTVVDSAGRRVEVPAKIERVFAAGGPASIFMYTSPPTSSSAGLPRSPRKSEPTFQLHTRIADTRATNRPRQYGER
jgi:ABC-type Fe3+-hydroxamate transport system substrate-binding protein